MQRLSSKSIPASSVSALLEDRPFYALYRVIPAGRDFFHILEVPSGRIKGFRSGHNQACALAKELEALLSMQAV